MAYTKDGPWWTPMDEQKEKIPNISPIEFVCEVCDRIRPPDEFQSYDPLICINCDTIDMMAKFKW